MNNLRKPVVADYSKLIVFLKMHREYKVKDVYVDIMNILYFGKTKKRSRTRVIYAYPEGKSVKVYYRDCRWP